MMPTSAVLAAPPIRFTSFDIPGASNYAVAGINDKGTVVGGWTPVSNPFTLVGFIRSRSGHITTPVLDPNDTQTFTELRAINNRGLIAGFYFSNAAHGFLLVDGLFMPVDFPGALDTALRGINDRGDLAGSYDTSPTGDQIGFIIPHRGARISFGPPPGGSGIVVGKINDRREVVGYYVAADGFTLTGFLREPDGRLVDFIVPGAVLTLAFDINDCGIIVGHWDDDNFVTHGFYGRPGSLHSFDLPGADGTISRGINNDGRLVGHYVVNGAPHGFVTEPIPGAMCDD
jgi:uncharacterized membrane protein